MQKICIIPKIEIPIYKLNHKHADNYRAMYINYVMIIVRLDEKKQFHKTVPYQIVCAASDMTVSEKVTVRHIHNLDCYSACFLQLLGLDYSIWSHIDNDNMENMTLEDIMHNVETVIIPAIN